MAYPFQKIEEKWQNYWEKSNLFGAEELSEKPKFYVLVEFPYPSGKGLHVGHCRSYTAMDIIARKRRMEGQNVLFPIGWDAFGLPAENYAIKTGTHPKESTTINVANYKHQMKRLAFSFDWNREINTTDPSYYKWTQWIFLQLFKKGLAYKAKMPINWCLSCKVGLANEEVVEGKCERCRGEIEKKDKEQWMIRITEYADRLLEDLNRAVYSEKIRAQQREWIGKSEGSVLRFEIQKGKNIHNEMEVFTTRPDTLFGATYLVLAPEHELIQKLKEQIGNRNEVISYITEAKKKTDTERTAEGKKKTGVELEGIKAVNPGNGEEIPVFVADYVLRHYGTGAIMAVPAHDRRDFEFAKQFGIPICRVIKKEGGLPKDYEEVYEGEGILINSGSFDGIHSSLVRERITKFVSGRKLSTYKLRDWVFSRQHYWGEPIPIVFCEKCGQVAIPEKDLPVELPWIEHYKPTDAGESPLASVKEWVNTTCPECGGPAQRETDTMPNWAGSNWYYMRYCDPDNNEQPASMKKLKYWMPVDWYNGGMEHTTLHLLYSRFIYKFLYDIGVAPDPEPYAKRTSHGVVLAEDGSKMSKSRGNVINPDKIISKYGADTLRVYEMFIGDFEQMVAWNTRSINGVHRFLNRVWELTMACKGTRKSSQRAITEVQRLQKKVNERLERMKFNTAVSVLMEFVNFAAANKKEIGRDVIERMLILLSPLTPHLAEELWRAVGHKESVFLEPWPKPEKLIEERTILIIQINGRIRHRIEVNLDISEAEAKALALSQEVIKRWMGDKEIKKIIFVPGKLVNIVI